LASGHGCRSSVDLAGRTRKIKISAQEFSLKVGAPNPRSKTDEGGRFRLPWLANLSGKNNVEEKKK
jgi:hypothetical protein